VGLVGNGAPLATMAIMVGIGIIGRAVGFHVDSVPDDPTYLSGSGCSGKCHKPLNLLSLLLELISLPFFVVTNSTICTHSIALVDFLLVLGPVHCLCFFMLIGDNT